MPRIQNEEVLKGPETWMKLSRQLLCAEGKDIVSADPDLTEATITQLKEVYNNQLRNCHFYFGEEKNSDIGIAALSMCIRDNPSSTMAELIARYADLRGTPFLETALAVLRYKEEHGLSYYENRSRAIVSVSWVPESSISYIKPPRKKFA